MFRFQPVMLTSALLVFGATLSPCQAALIFGFSYNFSGNPAASASGTITTVDTPTVTPYGTGYEMIDISGFRTLSGTNPSFEVTQPITGVVPQSFGRPNLLYPGEPTVVDDDGLYFFVGANFANVYFDGVGYTENVQGVGNGDFTLRAIEPDPQPSEVPEPHSALLLGSGLILLSACRRLRSRKPS